MKTINLNWDGELFSYKNTTLDAIKKEWEARGGVFVEDMAFKLKSDNSKVSEFEVTLNI